MIQFVCKHFNDLSNLELYQILKARNEVFILEQNCTYIDCDNRDLECYHLMGFVDAKLAAYSRLLPIGLSYDSYCSIGRVLTVASARRLNYGKTLIEKSIEMCDKLFHVSIKIGAQTYLEKFYSDFGFESNGHHYLEDDIPHTSMILKR